MLLPNCSHSLQCFLTSYGFPVITMEIVPKLSALVSFDRVIVAAVATAFLVMFVPSMASFTYTVSPS